MKTVGEEYRVGSLLTRKGVDLIGYGHYYAMERSLIYVSVESGTKLNRIRLLRHDRG